MGKLGKLKVKDSQVLEYSSIGHSIKLVSCRFSYRLGQKPTKTVRGFQHGFPRLNRFAVSPFRPDCRLWSHLTLSATFMLLLLFLSYLFYIFFPLTLFLIRTFILSRNLSSSQLEDSNYIFDRSSGNRGNFIRWELNISARVTFRFIDPCISKRVDR